MNWMISTIYPRGNPSLTLSEVFPLSFPFLPVLRCILKLNTIFSFPPLKTHQLLLFSSMLPDLQSISTIFCLHFSNSSICSVKTFFLNGHKHRNLMYMWLRQLLSCSQITSRKFPDFSHPKCSGHLMTIIICTDFGRINRRWDCQEISLFQGLHFLLLWLIGNTQLICWLIFRESGWAYTCQSALPMFTILVNQEDENTQLC